MIDERQRVLAHNLIHNAVQLQKGEKVWINLVDCDASIACALEMCIRDSHRGASSESCHFFVERAPPASGCGKWMHWG